MHLHAYRCRYREMIRHCAPIRVGGSIELYPDIIFARFSATCRPKRPKRRNAIMELIRKFSRHVSRTNRIDSTSLDFDAAIHKATRDRKHAGYRLIFPRRRDYITRYSSAPIRHRSASPSPLSLQPLVPRSCRSTSRVSPACISLSLSFLLDRSGGVDAKNSDCFLPEARNATCHLSASLLLAFSFHR